MKNILYILSGNLSTTPRALKVILSTPKNISFRIVLINRDNRWNEKDKALIEQHNLDVVSLNLTRKPLLKWMIITIFYKLARLFYPIFPNRLDINGYASEKSSIILWRYLLSHNMSNLGLIIGHSYGSLYPTWKLSKRLNVPFCFDIEDFHPGENINNDIVNEIKRRKFLIKNILPHASCLTSASPLIGEYTLKLIGNHKSHQVILNSFPQKEFSPPIKKSNNQVPSLNLVWYSQTISFNRGIEQFLEAILQIKNPQSTTIKITLIGNLDLNFNENIIQSFQKKIKDNNQLFLNIKPPLQQDQLHKELSNYDIGLALEFNNSELNRQICLTNKIISYLQAGLFIFATDTDAQKQFMYNVQNHNVGVLCGQSKQELTECLEKIIEYPYKVYRYKDERFNTGKKFCWEKEKSKLNCIWTKL